jgi:hypothetical protein
MKLTLSLDEKLILRCREIARRQGISLNEMLRGYLRTVADLENDQHTVAATLTRLWEQSPGRSGCRKIARDEAYERQQ